MKYEDFSQETKNKIKKRMGYSYGVPTEELSKTVDVIMAAGEREIEGRRERYNMAVKLYEDKEFFCMIIKSKLGEIHVQNSSEVPSMDYLKKMLEVSSNFWVVQKAEDCQDIADRENDIDMEDEVQRNLFTPGQKKTIQDLMERADTTLKVIESMPEVPTIRDQFAMAILPILMDKRPDMNENPPFLNELAYKWADAAINARVIKQDNEG